MMETISELPRTPAHDDCVKRLFGEAAREREANTSEYFSLSGEDLENAGSQEIISPQVGQ